MSPREQKGRELAELGRILKHRNMWLVPASKSGKKYTVDPVSGHCNCPDHQLRKVRCKHLIAVELTIQQQVTVKETTRPDGSTTVIKTETVTKSARVTYRQNWQAYNAAQTEEKHRFAELLRDLCQGIPEPEHTFGRPRLPLADMVFASAYKVYTGFSSRRFTCDLEDMQADGLISKAGHSIASAGTWRTLTSRRFSRTS